MTAANIQIAFNCANHYSGNAAAAIHLNSDVIKSLCCIFAGHSADLEVAVWIRSASWRDRVCLGDSADLVVDFFVK